MINHESIYCNEQKFFKLHAKLCQFQKRAVYQILNKAMYIASKFFLVLVYLEAFAKIFQLQLCWMFLLKKLADSEFWVGLLGFPHLATLRLIHKFSFPYRNIIHDRSCRLDNGFCLLMEINFLLTFYSNLLNYNIFDKIFRLIFFLFTKWNIC